MTQNGHPVHTAWRDTAVSCITMLSTAMHARTSKRCGVVTGSRESRAPRPQLGQLFVSRLFCVGRTREGGIDNPSGNLSTRQRISTACIDQPSGPQASNALICRLVHSGRTHMDIDISRSDRSRSNNPTMPAPPATLCSRSCDGDPTRIIMGTKELVQCRRLLHKCCTDPVVRQRSGLGI